MRNLPPFNIDEIHSRSISIKPLTTNKKTLIMDLDDTLIHTLCTPILCNELLNISPINLNYIGRAGTNEVLSMFLRQYAHEFLEQMSEIYEIIVLN